jgi:hypothetical protein
MHKYLKLKKDELFTPAVHFPNFSSEICKMRGRKEMGGKERQGRMGAPLVELVSEANGGRVPINKHYNTH